MSTAKTWREMPQRYRMEAAKCKSCGKVSFPPRLVCPKDGGREFETVRLADHGAVETFTIIRTPPTGFGDQVPYAVAVVKLDDGVRVTCQVVDCSPEELEIGTKVKMEFRKIQEDGGAGLIQYGYKAVPA